VNLEVLRQVSLSTCWLFDLYVTDVAAHKLYGHLPWEELVMPVAELAKGWSVSRELARRIRIFG
jgi:hypothetical protein